MADLSELRRKNVVEECKKKKKIFEGDYFS